MSATLSQFGTKTRITITGDESACRDNLGEVNRVLYQIRKLVEHQGVPIYRLEKKFADGTKIEALTVHGREYVWFHKPLTSKEEEPETDEGIIVVLFAEHFSWDLSSHSHPN